MSNKFVDDSSLMNVSSPNVSSPNVSSPNVNSPNVNVPQVSAPGGNKMVDNMLASVGLRVTDEGTA